MERPDTPTVILDSQNQMLKHGGVLYRTGCASCHQSDGRGMEGVGPPLQDSEWVSMSDEILVRIVLQGLHGAIEVNGMEYNLEMPAMGFYANEEIANILSYLRYTWGNKKPVSTETTKRIREATENQIDSWNMEQLSEFL